MTDDETRAAVDALAYRIRARDAAIRAGEDVADPEPFAQEYVTGLRGHGWRPTEARPQAAWQRPPGSGRPPTDGYLAARAELDERLATPGGAS